MQPHHPAGLLRGGAGQRINLGQALAPATVRSISGTSHGKPAGKPRPLAAPAKIDRLLDELRTQQEDVLQAIKKTSLLVLADRDLRARETEQIQADLSAIDAVLDRNRQARQQRLNALIR